jgi:hypothetical protein
VGGITSSSGGTRLLNCIAAFNSGVGGQGGYGCAHGTCGYSSAGGGIGNFLGTITDAGHNLSSDDSGYIPGVGSFKSTDPKLGPLTNNGGPTLTMSLLPGSPALDAGDTAGAPTTDQRGVTRPFGLATDMGAFESTVPTYRLSLSVGDTVDLVGSGISSTTCWLLTSTNLLDWERIATNQVGINGTVRFQLPKAVDGMPHCYRLLWP